MKSKEGLILFFISIFFLGYYVAKQKDINPSSRPLFLECKVSSFPKFYYDKYKFDCNVVNSEVKNLKGQKIEVISDYEPKIFSNIYSIGKLKEKYGKFWFYTKTPFIKEEKSILFSPFLKIRDYLIKKFEEKTLNEKSFAIGNALIFGNRSYLDKETKNTFINTGLIHLLAISGLHVGIIIAILLFLLLPISRKFAYIFTILYLSIYPIIAGFHIPVIRASFMGILYLYGKLRYLLINPLNLFFMVAFVFIVLSPESIFSLGFQLSFAAVFGLIISKDIFNINLKNKTLTYIIQSVLVSFVASLWTAPLIIYTFKKFSITSIFATTFELLFLFPYLLLSIFNVLTMFFIKFLVNFMDYIGLIFIKSANFFESFGFQAKNLSLNFFETIFFYFILVLGTIYIKKFKLIFLFSLFIFLIFLSKF